ncbi:uncharacterized protein LOC108195276 [Daucus carota subsp. sativus]|uniref:uncharacterized protein LOC108195276 n=1 Tax=Daucus carota subsp. sativus TaxID=79200 RepID=UPI0007F03A00|nr:PREDICTED: receptor-interacting serine/threonine-protein kinase 4-like [Daucus carota subsp. sativus]
MSSQDIDMDSDLFAAAISGKRDILKIKHSRTAVGDQLTPTKNTVLHLASESGREECVEQILRTFPDLLCKKNSKGETALHVAVRGGHLNVVRVLLDYAEIADEESWKKKLEESAEKKLDKESVEKNDHRRLMRMLNKEHESALHEAVRHNHVNIVKFLVEKDPDDKYSANKHHMTPIYLATFKGHVASLEIIFSKKKEFGSDDRPDGRTLLHAAVMSRSTDCVRYILKNRSNLTSAKDKDGWTPLHYAAYFDFSAIIKDIITGQEKSIAYETDKSCGRTALHIAAQLGNLAAVKQLIQYCPYSCDMVDKKGRNILHLAVEYDHKAVIEYILKRCPMIQSILNQRDKFLLNVDKGISTNTTALNQKDKFLSDDDKGVSNNTPLHYAAKHGCFVPSLIKHKLVNRDALNKDSHTPLDLICGDNSGSGSEQEKVKNLLVQIGAAQNLNLSKELDMYKCLPRQYATDENLEMTRILSGTRKFVVAFIATIMLAVAANLFNLSGHNSHQNDSYL